MIRRSTCFYARANYGAAFRFLCRSRRLAALVLRQHRHIAIVTVLLVMMYRSAAQQKLNNIAYAFIIGGALSNLFDRRWHGFWSISSTSTSVDWHLPDLQLRTALSAWGAGDDRAGRFPVAGEQRRKE